MLWIRRLFKHATAKPSAPDGDRRLAQELVDRGTTAEGSGMLAEALHCYGKAIDADPRFAPAHMSLGIVQHAGGEFSAAIASHRQAIALDAGSAAAYYNLGLALLETGEAVHAEAAFREALRLRCEFPEACVGLAEALEALGRNEDALAALDTAIGQRDSYIGAQFNASALLLKMGRIEAADARLREIDLAALYASPNRHSELESFARQLIRVWPDYAPGWRALGTVLALQQRFEEAVPALQKTLMWLPSDAEIHNNLGAALQVLGRSLEAAASYRHALELEPGSHLTHNNMGLALQKLGRLAEAESSFCRALELKADYHEASTNLGNILQFLGRFCEAEKSYRHALALEPDSHLTHNNLGITLQNLGRLSEAQASYRRALELKPDYHEAHTNLGNAQQALRRLSEAEASYRRALELKPDSHATHSNLGSALKELGRLDEAESSFRRALELDPDYHEARSNLLFTLNYTNRLSRAELFAEHLAWARRHEAPLVAQRQIHGNTRDPHRRLRIGYVSPDFRRHSVAYFIEPLLARHERAACEVFCYSNVINPDSMTQRLLGLADCARSIVGMSDTRAAELVRSDGIDILVDLAGHTGKGRLGLFARKPAPVQVGYLGYPNTTGLTAIDWRLTDIHADPPSAHHDDEFYSERLVRLPHTFLCYLPPEQAPAIQPPPSDKNGCVTFGSFNALPKVSAEVIRAWGRLLERVPGSRLLLKAPGLSDSPGRGRLLGEFGQQGIRADRLILLPMEDEFRDHLARYHEVDIALDPFPYNGTTTTLEALWMGVPVVSIAGERHGARVGASILANLGLDALIAGSVEEYLTLATGLAMDRTRVAWLRETMRDRICASPLRDEADFARVIQNAYRQMWRRWCEA